MTASGGDSRKSIVVPFPIQITWLEIHIQMKQLCFDQQKQGYRPPKSDQHIRILYIICVSMASITHSLRDQVFHLIRQKIAWNMVKPCIWGPLSWSVGDDDSSIEAPINQQARLAEKHLKPWTETGRLPMVSYPLVAKSSRPGILMHWLETSAHGGDHLISGSGWCVHSHLIVDPQCGYVLIHDWILCCGSICNLDPYGYLETLDLWHA